MHTAADHTLSRKRQSSETPVDFRKIQWDSEAIHHKAKISAGVVLIYFSAILNHYREGQSFENEFFFTQKKMP